MKTIDIPATKSAPSVLFSEDDNTLKMAGECYPENSFTFFQPIFEWLHEALPQQKDLYFHVNISYMNSSSTKCMLDILDLLGDTERHNCSVSVRWHYEKGNDRALELAEDFMEEVKIPFEIVPEESQDFQS